MVAGRVAEQDGVAVGLADDAEQDLDEGGLAGPVLAEQAEDLARLDPERDPLEGLDPAVVLAEVGCRYDRHGPLPECPSGPPPGSGRGAVCWRFAG